MDLVTPGFGLVFWTTLSFLIIIFLLGKFAWSPILKAIKEREDTIQLAIESAEKAKEEMRKLKDSNDALLQAAREERDKLMKEARDTKDQIISEAKTKAKEEAEKIVTASREEIRNEKAKAIIELKDKVAEISFEIAEKVLSEKLSSSDKQSDTVKSALSEIRFN
jgi:F-type H+-transporting ATPase subunit b